MTQVIGIEVGNWSPQNGVSGQWACSQEEWEVKLLGSSWASAPCLYPSFQVWSRGLCFAQPPGVPFTKTSMGNGMFWTSSVTNGMFSPQPACQHVVAFSTVRRGSLSQIFQPRYGLLWELFKKHECHHPWYTSAFKWRSSLRSCSQKPFIWSTNTVLRASYLAGNYCTFAK